MLSLSQVVISNWRKILPKDMLRSSHVDIILLRIDVILKDVL